MIGWSGIFHILATPFREDGALDTEGLAHLVESALATGITGLTILGIAGEAHRLTDEERGADGAMTGFPYPEALRAIRDRFVAGRRDEARALFYRWPPPIRYETQPGATPGTGVGIRKEILRRRGWLASATVRPPAPSLDAATFAEIGEILTAVGA
jgi:4-hydroxy-tetrahydrodipicolinate synthase